MSTAVAMLAGQPFSKLFSGLALHPLARVRVPPVEETATALHRPTSYCSVLTTRDSFAAMIKRALWVFGCSLLYLSAVAVVGFGIWAGWLMFVVFVLHGVGCDGGCNGVGQFTLDNWGLLVGAAAALAAALFLPVYRWMLRASDEAR
jgi:hypothetical protein